MSSSLDEVVISVKDRAARKPDRLTEQVQAVFSGVVVRTGLEVENVRSGHQVLVIDTIGALKEMNSTAGTIGVSCKHVFKVPDMISGTGACTYLAALIQAVAILKQELGISFSPEQTRPERGPHGQIPTGSRIAIVGGETELAAALTQVLRRASHDTRILLTCCIHNQEELFQRACHLVRLGDAYAIDGAITDLMDYVDRKDLGVIVNTVKGMPVRPDLLDILSGPKALIECSDIDISATLSSLPLSDHAFVAALHSMLAEAATVFAEHHEPPEECGFQTKD